MDMHFDVRYTFDGNFIVSPNLEPFDVTDDVAKTESKNIIYDSMVYLMPHHKYTSVYDVNDFL